MRMYFKRNGENRIDLLTGSYDYDVIKTIQCRNVQNLSIREIADKLMQVYELFVGDTLIEVTNIGTHEIKAGI